MAGNAARCMHLLTVVTIILATDRWIQTDNRKNNFGYRDPNGKSSFSQFGMINPACRNRNGICCLKIYTEQSGTEGTLMNKSPQRDSRAAKTLSPILPDDVEAAAAALLEVACEADLRLATAESCTGGLLASLLTDVEGASHAFERGFAVYSEEAKCELLDIRREQIDACGAVSREVAIAMAEGAIARSHADIALAITGFAGAAPDGQEAGLVHFASARRNGATVHRVEHFGDIGRGPVRIKSLRVALEMLEQAIDRP